jgi:hypothetical protein
LEEDILNNQPIRNYEDFVSAVLAAGFSMGGGNDEGIFSVINWGWNDSPPYETPVRWHTGNPDTDPWEWRIRVLDERKDIAYAKVFFKKSGYISKEWAPYFLAVRRGNTGFDEEYDAGLVSHNAKRIYETILEYETLPVHAIKQVAGFDSAEKSAFDRALTELQMKLYLTMCGRQQKVSQKGEQYGWSSTVFTTTETFWGEDVFTQASKVDEKQAIERIKEQILKLNPVADEKKMMKFIKG